MDILNNFSLDIEKSYPTVLFCRLEHCFLLSFTPEIEVLFARPLTDFHEYSSCIVFLESGREGNVDTSEDGKRLGIEKIP